MSTLIATLATLLAGSLYASLFEWTLHRYLMHRPVGLFSYPFRTHTLTHHRIFKADDTYHYSGIGDRSKIRMAWWNGPVLVLFASIPFVLGALPFALMSWWMESSAIFGTGVFVAAMYYAAYEYLHWCMHLPGTRWVERFRLFRRINGHHILHHRYMGRNFNVVLPFADLVFGTLLTRAKTRFAQVRGLSVPDVQPL